MYGGRKELFGSVCLVCLLLGDLASHSYVVTLEMVLVSCIGMASECTDYGGTSGWPFGCLDVVALERNSVDELA